MKNKIKDLDKRIGEISKEMDTLLQTKINLMMLKRNLGMDQVKKNLEDSFTDELKDMLKEKLDD